MIHADHWNERVRITTALGIDFLPNAQKCSRTMDTCASTASLQVNAATEKVAPSFFRCRQRLCPLCSTARSRLLTERFADLMAKMTAPRTLVLTIKHEEAGLAVAIANLRNWFSKLRRSKLWLANVIQGAYSLEIKIGKGSGLWHPHLHIVFDGLFLPWQLLRKEWHAITGGSQIVWLEPVSDVDGMARELAKYVSKPYDMTTFTDAQIREFFQATHGLRMFTTFGKRPAKDPDVEDPGDTWDPENYSWTLPQLAHLANLGVPEAAAVAGLAAVRWPILGRYVYAAIGDGIQLPAQRRNALSGKLRPLMDVDIRDLDAKLRTAFEDLRRIEAGGLLPVPPSQLAPEE